MNPTPHDPHPPFVYLASQSPRRAALLDQIGVAHRPLPHDAGVDAEALEAVVDGESPTDYVGRVVHAKLHAAVERLRRRGWPLAPVLCADTTVALGPTIFGKPADDADAFRMLQALSGRVHQVHTGVALARPDGVHEWLLHTSDVRFESLDPARIQAYVRTGEPSGKAGAYAIQGRAAAFIAEVRGSPSGVMGLPLHETAALLRRAGLPV